MACCGIWEKFREEETLLKEYSHWKLLVKSKQTTLGALIAVTKRHRDKFSEVTPEEMAEFAQVSGDAERMLHANFQPSRIQYLALMRKDSHVHFHIIPRYEHPVRFADQDWIDKAWPRATIFPQVEESPKELVMKLKGMLTKPSPQYP